MGGFNYEIFRESGTEKNRDPGSRGPCHTGGDLFFHGLDPDRRGGRGRFFYGISISEKKGTLIGPENFAWITDRDRDRRGRRLFSIRVRRGSGRRRRRGRSLQTGEGAIFKAAKITG